MYVSLVDWIKVTFSQDAPIAAQNEITPTEIEQLMLLSRILDPTRASKMANSRDTVYKVSDATAKVTITMRDLDGAYQYFGHGYNYWFHPDHFDVLVNDVVVDDHLYYFYPVDLSLTFLVPRAAADVVKVRGHVMDKNKLMWGVASQWLLKISMVGDIESAVFERMQNRFNRMCNRLYGPRMLRRTH
jgi:hypothetical protein